MSKYALFKHNTSYTHYSKSSLLHDGGDHADGDLRMNS